MVWEDPSLEITNLHQLLSVWDVNQYHLQGVDTMDVSESIGFGRSIATCISKEFPEYADAWEITNDVKNKPSALA